MRCKEYGWPFVGLLSRLCGWKGTMLFLMTSSGPPQSSFKEFGWAWWIMAVWRRSMLHTRLVWSSRRFGIGMMFLPRWSINILTGNSWDLTTASMCTKLVWGSLGWPGPVWSWSYGIWPRWLPFVLVVLDCGFGCEGGGFLFFSFCLGPFGRVVFPAQASNGWAFGCICVSLYNESSFHLRQKKKAGSLFCP